MVDGEITQSQFRDVIESIDVGNVASALIKRYTWFSFPPINPKDMEEVQIKRERKTDEMQSYPEQIHWDLKWDCQPACVQFHTYRHIGWKNGRYRPT